jgi:hypothetical protein
MVNNRLVTTGTSIVRQIYADRGIDLIAHPDMHF